MRAATDRLFLPFALAATLCALNALKPVTVDDPAYLYMARQIATHPTDPYGFDLLWYDEPEPANTILMPPVLPCWLAVGMKLVGDNVFLLKLWLFPFCLALVGGVYLLARRFAPGREDLLAALTAFSPLYLPGLSIMLDVPAIGLGLVALAAFFRALDAPIGKSVLWAVLAGLLAGLSIQTKYSGAVFPVVMGLAALTHRRWLRGLLLAVVAGVVATGVFLSWEVFTHFRYGESHFVHHFNEARKGGENRKKSALILPLFAMLGGLGFPLAILALCVPRARWWLGAQAAWLFAAGLALTAYWPEETAVWLRNADGQERLSVYSLFDALAGATVLAALALALLAPWLGRGGRHWRWLPDRTTVFLALWLATEVVAYFALSPFPAARRVTGLLAVATLIAGRYAAWAWRRSDLLGFLSPRPDVRAASWGDRYERPWAVGLVVAFGVALGGVYFLSDWLDADAERRAARDAILWARSQAAEGERVWYVGHWGFQFYADELGVPPVVARDSELSAGDWIVQPEFRIYQQEVGWKRAPRYPVRTFVYEDAWPLRTIWYFYAGRRPLEPCRGPRLTAKVYRAREDFLAPAWRADGDEYDP